MWLFNNVVVVSDEERRDSTKLMHEVIHFKYSRLLCKILTTELNQGLWAMIWGQQECDDNLQNSEKRVRKLQPDLSQAPAESESKAGLSRIPPGWLAYCCHLPQLTTQTVLPSVHSLYLINFLGCSNQQWNPQEIKRIDSVFGYHMEKRYVHTSSGPRGLEVFGSQYLLSFGEGTGTPLQYSCLENPMDRGAW